jgi:hypothetical protein
MNLRCSAQARGDTWSNRYVDLPPQLTGSWGVVSALLDCALRSKQLGEGAEEKAQGWSRLCTTDFR